MKNDNKQKVVLLTLLIIVTSILIVLTSISLYRSFKEEKVNITDNKIYGTVLEKGKNYIKLQDLSGEVFVVVTNDELSVGDFIVAYFASDDKDYSGKSNIEIIASEEDIYINDVIKDTDNSSNEVTSKVSESTSTTKKRTTTKKVVTSTNPTSSDEEVISYFSSEYEEVSAYSNSQSLKESAKEKFILFVDFIFYDGEIKGRKFEELTSSAKAKIIYYTILLDAKIESKWPNYKNNIDDKYNDIKAKLIAKYMEMTTSICENNEDNCANVKNDFALLKKSVGLTWDVIKGAFSYAYNKGVEQLVKWYEVFSGRQ